MKFLVIIPWVLLLVPVSGRSADQETPQPSATGKSDYEKIAHQIELAVRPVYQIPTVTPFNFAALYYAYENTVLTQFHSSEKLRAQKFDFPEKEFPEAPVYYGSPNAPEFEFPIAAKGK